MSAHPNDGGPAFPIPSDGHTHGTEGGMTLRDYFAAKALKHSMLAFSEARARARHDEIAEMAYIMADAMIRAREVQS